MNIALFPSSFHPHFGGVEELVRQLARQQRKQGHRPMILTNRWPKTLPESEEFEGLQVRRYVFRVPERTWKQAIGAALLGPSTLNLVCSDLVAHRTDVIHVQCVSSNAYYALLAKRRLKLPLVVTLQGELTMDASRLFERSEFARRLLRDAMSESDMITACSAKTLADGEAFYGSSFGGRARVVYNGAEAEDFQSATPFCRERPFILGIGRLVPQKGFDVLLRAFAKSAIKTHDLLIAGDGAERSSLEALSSELNLAGSVHFIGRADRALTASLFAGCSFLVIPSRTDEGLPVVIAEAMAAGRAIIGTRVGGVPEAILDGETGLIVPREDTTALCSALVRLVQDDDLRRSLGEGAHRRSGIFSWSAIADQYIDVYRSISTGH